MADDIEIGGPDLAHIAAPAATDRVALSTGPASGGYSRRDEFIWKDATGIFRADGSTLIPIGKAHTFFTQEYGIGTPDSAGLQIFCASNDDMRFGVRNGAVFTERMKMTANGFFGIGDMPYPAVRFHVKSTGEIARFETTTARGGGSCFLTFYDPSGRKSYLGYGQANENFLLLNEMNGAFVIGTNNLERLVIEADGSTWRPGADNVTDLGKSFARMKDIRAVNGAIVTSDERDKTWREMLGIGVALFAPNLYEAELRAGLRIIDEIGVYQWNDAIALKGPDEARPHIGPRAQRVWAICAEEGLCPALVQREPGGDWLPPEGSIPPAFLCFDEWGEETAQVMAWWRPSAILGPDGEPVMVPCEEGEEGTEQRPTDETYVTRPAGNRFGVRIDQLHSLMIAALNAERLAQAMTGEEQAVLFAELTTRLELLEAAA